MLPNKPKPRWFRFSLRTLFVLVTVVACALGWLVWQIQIVRERKAIIAEINRVNKLAESGSAQTHRNRGLETLQSDPKRPFEWTGFPYARASRIRLLLGDESYFALYMSSTLDPEWIRRAEYAFPEAELHVFDYPARAAAEAASFDPSKLNLGEIGYRDSLTKDQEDRLPNRGDIFETGFVYEDEKPADN